MKGRSFSTTVAPLLLHMGPMSRRGHSIKERERKTVCSLHPLSVSELKQLQSDFSEEKCKDDSFCRYELPGTEECNADPVDVPYMAKNCSARGSSQTNLKHVAQGKSGVTTSDYDSCESPCGSEIFENNTATPFIDISDRSDTLVAKDRSWVRPTDAESSQPPPQQDELISPTINAKYIPRLSISSDPQQDDNPVSIMFLPSAELTFAITHCYVDQNIRTFPP